jgi:Transposase DDE domain
MHGPVGLVDLSKAASAVPVLTGQADEQLHGFFLKKLLEVSFRQKFKTLFDKGLFGSFNNVLVQDATHFSLPRSLCAVFPGSYSKYGEAATAKVQAVFSLTKGVFSNFKLCSFRDNDQKDALRIVEMINKGDLVIRDLGYFTLPSFISIKGKGAHFLSRFRYGLIVHDTDTGCRFNLLRYLKKNGRIDKWVEIGTGQKLKCRIVAVPLSKKIAAERRRKAKADRNKKANHSAAYLELLGYSIYITSVSSEIWSPRQVAQAYRCRWYIEILFKGWKSGLHIKLNIPERYVDQQRAEFFFYASLLLVSLVVVPIFIRATMAGFKLGRCISMLKTCSFIIQEIQTLNRSKRLDRLLDHIVYHCAYEHRKSRINAIELILSPAC